MTPLQYLYRARENLRTRQAWLARARMQPGPEVGVVRHYEDLVCEALDELWAAQQWVASLTALSHALSLLPRSSLAYEYGSRVVWDTERCA